MSKIVVYILDKAVWLLLITVIASQSLQIVGIMETPKSAGSIEYQMETLKRFQAESVRWKRDAAEMADRSSFIDMLFNIPIKTLSAMNNLIQNSRPMFRKLREFVAKRFETTIRASGGAGNIQKRSYPVYFNGEWK